MIKKNTLRFEQSLNEARWVMPDVTLDQVEQMVRAHNALPEEVHRGEALPEIVARLLCSRSVEPDPEAIRAFLYPTLAQDFPDPFSMVDMDEMVSYMAQAIIDQRQIAIFGDFDVDGAASSAVLYRFLKHCGFEAPVYIPQRLTEGYGPNIEAFKELKDGGTEIVVLLDCGTMANETIGQAKDLGLEIVVFDHHEPGKELPPANFIINPKRKDDASDLDMLAAVGVTFLCCVAINSKLRELDFFKSKDDEAPLKEWLDMVALGTVCDMVPLTGASRLFTQIGFALMPRTENKGLKALIEVSRVQFPFKTNDAGWGLGPRINAGSRVGDSSLGATLLRTDDPEEAKNIAWRLNDYNDQRKAVQEQMQQDAFLIVDEQNLSENPMIIVDHEDWHQGMNGLVAGNLVRKYSKPACVISYAENPEGIIEGRGSARSIPGVNLATAMEKAVEEELLIKGGGHAMAAGLSVLPEKFKKFKTFMCGEIQRQMDDGEVNVTSIIDGISTVQGASIEAVKMMERLVGPFGQEFPEPLILFSHVRAHGAYVMKDVHIGLRLGDLEGGSRIKALVWNAVGTPIGEAFLKHDTQPFHVLGRLKINNWQGREEVELHIEDAAFADVSFQSVVAVS